MASSRPKTIGIDTGDLRTDLRTALRQASALDFRALEIPAADGELEPRQLSSSARREVSRFVEGLGLSLAALSADMPALRLTDSRSVEERVERTSRILDLARDLRVGVVTAGVGPLTNPQSGKPSELAMEALGRIGELADSRGVIVALRPSFDAGERLSAVLATLRCPAIRVCWDPAGMVMTGANPLASVERFIEQVAMIHVRDGTAGFAGRDSAEARHGHEASLGEGDVDYIGVLDALRSADYRGPYVLRRTESANPASDLTAARDALLRIMPAR